MTELPHPQLQQDQAYIEHHPDAVTDPAKAEIMAYASKEAEETVVNERQTALGHAALVGGEGYNENGYLGRQAAKRAQEARTLADAQAREAADIYDAVGRVTDPAKAEIMAYASKEAEETVVREHENTERAQKARTEADAQAREAADIYDAAKRSPVVLGADEIGSSNLVADPAKAEIMAYASNAAETLAVEESDTALDHATRVSEPGYNSNGYLGRQAAKRAQEARVIADAQAREAADIYDAVKSL